MARYAGEPRFTSGASTIHVELDVVTPARQVALAIPLSYWESLTRQISGLRPDLRPWAIAYSIFFGIGVTAGLSIAPIVISGLPSWLVTLYASISAAALALGIGLVIGERALSRRQSSQADFLTDEMTRMRDTYLQDRTTYGE